MHPGDTRLAGCSYADASMDASFDSLWRLATHIYHNRVWTADWMRLARDTSRWMHLAKTHTVHDRSFHSTKMNSYFLSLFVTWEFVINLDRLQIWLGNKWHHGRTNWIRNMYMTQKIIQLMRVRMQKKITNNDTICEYIIENIKVNKKKEKYLFFSFCKCCCINRGFFCFKIFQFYFFIIFCVCILWFCSNSFFVFGDIKMSC